MNKDFLVSHSERNLFWKASTVKDRFQVIQEIETCVAHYGFISDFKQFSDLDMNLCLEVETPKINDLFKALQSILHVDDQGSEPDMNKTSQIIYLHLSFLKGTGDLKIEVPAVPG
ncbi:MAG: hypothetical protein ACKOXF_03195 [Chitinophagaceae bacterium]